MKKALIYIGFFLVGIAVMFLVIVFGMRETNVTSKYVECSNKMISAANTSNADFSEVLKDYVSCQDEIFGSNKSIFVLQN